MVGAGAANLIRPSSDSSSRSAASAREHRWAGREKQAGDGVMRRRDGQAHPAERMVQSFEVQSLVGFPCSADDPSQDFTYAPVDTGRRGGRRSSRGWGDVEQDAVERRADRSCTEHVQQRAERGVVENTAVDEQRLFLRPGRCDLERVQVVCLFHDTEAEAREARAIASRPSPKSFLTWPWSSVRRSKRKTRRLSIMDAVASPSSWMGTGCASRAVAVTVMSGADYFWRLRRLLSNEAAVSWAAWPAPRAVAVTRRVQSWGSITGSLSARSESRC